MSVFWNHTVYFLTIYQGRHCRPNRHPILLFTDDRWSKNPLGKYIFIMLNSTPELLDNTIFHYLILSSQAKLFILKNFTFFPINLCIQSMFFLSSSFRIFICLQLDWNQIIALNRIIWWLILLLLYYCIIIENMHTIYVKLAKISQFASVFNDCGRLFGWIVI